MSVTTEPALRRRVQWVIAELDGSGRIDDHAAMCLHSAIDTAHSSAIETILVDLRDLTAITTDGLQLFARHSGDCCAHGVDFALLIGGDHVHGEIAEAFVLAGLGEQLQFASDTRARTAAPADRPLAAADRVSHGRLARAAGHLAAHRRRRSRPT